MADISSKELNVWWASLTIGQKERIASKIKSRENDGRTVVVNYPECSDVWNSLPVESQRAIYQHCTDDHGLLLQEWTEGWAFSY